MNQYRQNEKDVPNCSGIGKLVSVLHRRAQAFYTRYLKEYDISLAEYPVLFMLSTHDGVTQDEIAWDQGMDKAAVARVIKSLEAKGRGARILLTEDAIMYSLQKRGAVRTNRYRKLRHIGIR